MICVGANGRGNGFCSLFERLLFLARILSIPCKVLLESTIDDIRINDRRYQYQRCYLFEMGGRS